MQRICKPNWDHVQKHLSRLDFQKYDTMVCNQLVNYDTTGWFQRTGMNIPPGGGSITKQLDFSGLAPFIEMLLASLKNDCHATHAQQERNSKI